MQKKPDRRNNKGLPNQMMENIMEGQSFFN